MLSTERTVGGLSIDRTYRILATLVRKTAETGGDPEELLLRLERDDLYSDRIAMAAVEAQLRTGAPMSSVAEIMGPNFFGPAEWEGLFEERIPGAAIPDIPWSLEMFRGPCPFHAGRELRDTHFLFLGISELGGRALTINHWHELFPPLNVHYGPEDIQDVTWHRDYAFASATTCRNQWYLVLIPNVPEVVGESFADQVGGIGQAYTVAPAIAEVTKHALYYKRHGKMIPDFRPNDERRCSDPLPPLTRIAIRGIGFTDVTNDARRGCGIATMRKPRW